MTPNTTPMAWLLRGTAILALTVAGTAAMAQDVTLPSTDDGTADGAGIDNTVTLTGNYGGDEYTITAFENVDVEAANADLDITKTATMDDDNSAIPAGGVVVGDVIRYTYLVNNPGNVTMTTLALVDNHLNAATATGDLSDIVCSTITESALATNTTGDTTLPTTNDNTILTLGAGDSVTCVATYTVEQADIDTLQP